MREATETVDSMLLLGSIAFLALLSAAAAHGELDWRRGALAALFGCVAVALTRALLARLRAGESVGLESHWGGLGGGLGGVRLSTPGLLLLAAVACYAACAVLTLPGLTWV